MALGFLDYDAIVRVHLGPLSISPHGLGTAVGFLAGARLMLPAARRRGITEVQVYAMLSRAAVGAIVGARVAYVVNHLGRFENPLEWFAIWEGGISLLGGIAGGVIASLPVMRAQRLSFWRVMDAAAPGLALGITIGRIGDLIVADHLGKPTEFALGYVCRGRDTASPCIAPVGQAVHQPALYDLVSASLLLCVLLWLRRKPRYDGFLILFFAAWYGVGSHRGGLLPHRRDARDGSDRKPVDGGRRRCVELVRARRHAPDAVEERRGGARRGARGTARRVRVQAASVAAG
ncbi:MAG: prolipoprotein diacylglyceryl transferase [Acidimicrobiales bacterium]